MTGYFTLLSYKKTNDLKKTNESSHQQHDSFIFQRFPVGRRESFAGKFHDHFSVSETKIIKDFKTMLKTAENP